MIHCIHFKNNFYAINVLSRFFKPLADLLNSEMNAQTETRASCHTYTQDWHLQLLNCTRVNRNSLLDSNMTLKASLPSTPSDSADPKPSDAEGPPPSSDADTAGDLTPTLRQPPQLMHTRPSTLLMRSL